MKDAFARSAAVVVVLAITLWSAGCASPQRTIQQCQEKLESLAASTALLVDDFLGGQLSTTYTRTALDAIFTQVEQQRAALAATPELLADRRAAGLSQQAGQLSRLIAQMDQDVARGDAATLKARRSAIPLVPDAK